MSRFREITLSEWNDIHSINECLFSFVFRGQSDKKWDLSSSFERSIISRNNHYTYPENIEHWILHDFKEKFHLYSSNPPDKNNNFEWLALLQHHGCSTRLLDFSESIYLATHFAINEAVSESSIWAVNWLGLTSDLRENPSLDYPKNVLWDVENEFLVSLVNEYIANNKMTELPPLVVVPLKSVKQSARLSRQQGLFLAPLNMGEKMGKTTTFMENLAASFHSTFPIKFSPITLDTLIEESSEPTTMNNIDILKINIPSTIQMKARDSLMKMNITNETLFPDIDGLASSLLQKHL